MAQKGAVRGTAALARSETGRKHRVEVATRRQRWRYEAELCNGEVDDALFVHRFDLGARLREALDTLGISACGPTARIAATIADLRGDEEPSKQDLAEALAYSTERRGTPTGGAAR